MHPIMTELYVEARSRELLQEAERHRIRSLAASPAGRRRSVAGALRRIALPRAVARRRTRAAEAVAGPPATSQARTRRPASCAR